MGEDDPGNPAAAGLYLQIRQSALDMAARWRISGTEVGLTLVAAAIVACAETSPTIARELRGVLERHLARQAVH